MSRSRPRIPWTVILAAATALPIILMGFDRGRGQFDQEFFHEPAIRTFAAEWPHFDFKHYLSATTPGYHLFLAAIVHWLTGSLVVLKLVALTFGLAFLWILERAVQHRLLRANHPRPSLAAVALCLPVACSSYVYMANAWLLPDNAGWLGVLLAILFGLRISRGGWNLWNWLGALISLTALLWVRQSHLWAAGAVCAGAWMSVTDPLAGAGSRLGDTSPRIRRTALAALSAVPAFLCLVYFYRLWGGLVPPDFKEQVGSGPNPATPAFILTLFAVFGLFFIGWWWGGLVRIWRSPSRWLLLLPCIAIALLLAIVPETTHSNQGLVRPRDTGLWLIVKQFDQRGLILFGRTSPVILLGAPAGALVLASLLKSQNRREGWTFAGAIFGFTLAASASALAWQRYLEPFILLMLPLMSIFVSTSRTFAPSARPSFQHHLRWLGPIVLALLLAAYTLLTLLASERPVKTW